MTVRRPHLELFARWMEQQGRMPSTIGRRLSTLSTFYRYCEVEELIDKNPAAHLRRPKVSTESRTVGQPSRHAEPASPQADLATRASEIRSPFSHADPRTTMRYDRARQSLDRHATYVVSTFLAGATRPG